MTLADGRPDILVNGAPITSIPLLGDALLELTVNSNMHMPSMFVMKFEDTNELGTQPATTFRFMDKPLPFMIGAKVVITAYSAPGGYLLPAVGPLITGEITAIEAEFNDDGTAVLVVRGYDPSHRLRRGKKSFTYMMQNDTAIVAQVCGKAAVPVVPMPTTTIHEHVLQNNQTDWDFLHERARRNGYDMIVDNLGILQFQPKGVPVVRGIPPVLTWGDNLKSFNPRISAAGMRASVMVNAWDAKLKIPAVGVLPVLPVPPGGGAMAIADMSTSMGIFGVANDVISDDPVGMPTEPMVMAKGRMQEIQGRFIQADGECLGHPGLYAGCKATVLGVGLKFSGPYTLSSATHVFTNGGMHYVTRFSVTGSDPDTLGGVLEPESKDRRGRINGVMVGIVTNNVDTMGQGRVKVMLPNLGMTPPVESTYARLAAPGAGLMSGIYWVPEIGDEVLLAFEHGDPNKPYVLGGLWSTPQLPPMPSTAIVVGGQVTQRILKSSNGHSIVFNDMPGMEAITIADKLGLSKIQLDITKKAVAISTLGDVTIDCLNFKVNAKANLEMMALAKATIKATAAANVESVGILKIKAATALNLDGAAVAVKANTMLKLDGLTVNVNNGALEII
jgi:hypothetical protein